MRPKGGRVAAAALTEPVSRYAEWLNETKERQWGGSRGNRPRPGALGDPCRMPNGSMRPKGGRGAAGRKGR
jgi:hypothetical protein